MFRAGAPTSPSVHALHQAARNAPLSARVDKPLFTALCKSEVTVTPGTDAIEGKVEKWRR